MSNRTREATDAAEELAVAAAGLTAEAERYDALAAERRRLRAEMWSDAQRGGMSYARLAAVAGLHPSKVHEAVLEYRKTEKRRRRAS